MNRTVKVIVSIVLSIIALLFVWYFVNIIFYILVAAVLSMVGHPMVDFFDKLKIGRFRMPHVMSAVLTLLFIVIIFGSFFSLFIPLVAQEARVVASIDTQSLASAFAQPLVSLEFFLHQYAILSPGQGIREVILERVHSFVSVASFTNAFNYMLSFTGAFFMAIFSILFICFFFLKDNRLLYRTFLLFIPARHNDAAARIINESKRLLTRYLLGLGLEVASMITLITLGLTILGVPNAMLIGFIGGLLNIIPYLGPLIGAAIGIVIGIIASVSLGAYTAILPLSLTIAGVFAGANLIDNLLLQPIIYSNSVRAHPIEIFLVIIIAGTLFGITGMILAVPAYTVMRIILREYFSEMRLIRKLTENM